MKKVAPMLMVTITLLFLITQVRAQDAANTQDVAGRKQGYWIKYNENQKKMYEGNFLDDIPQGKFIYYSETGKPRAITIFSKNGTVGRTQHFDADGKITGEGKYVNQKKDSLWKFYDIGGKIVSEEMYLEGVKNGSCKVFYSNGQLSESKIYLNGLQDGACVKYFEDGTVKYKGQYLKDKAEGKTTFYYPSGKVSVDGAYKNDFKSGTWNFYNEDGTIKKTVHYVNGKAQGKNDAETLTKEEEEKAKKKYEEIEIKDNSAEGPK